MPFPSELLEQAKHLANRERTKPKEASLRRAVSTAYYALFHLLISEAALNWKSAEQRPILARFFRHGEMKTASEIQRGTCKKFIDSDPQPGADLDCAQRLYQVADAFCRAQEARHKADYDNAKQWTRTDVLTVIDLVGDAFQNWRAVRNTPEARAYLISLLGRLPGHG
jgi:uncharacterized protein (UPF0332 family)